MAAPNIVGVTTISGKTSVQLVTTTPTAIVENTAASGKVVKVNALYISNVEGASAYNVNIDIYRNGVAYHLAKTLSVPADSTLDIISKSIYLEEGDSIRITADANSVLESICSYEEIS